MAVRSEPLQIFCSFAPEDEALYNQLHSHLRLLEREGVLTLWHQRLITAGTDWAKAIDEQLTSASIILLLISPAFFNSDYSYGVEMEQAMQQHNAGKTRVIPILLRPVDWTLASFAHLLLLPSNKKSIAEWRNRDAAFADIVTGLRHVIEELTPGSIGNMSRSTVSGVWNVPYRRNLYFTGRDELLKRLDQQLLVETQDEPVMCRAALTQPQAIKGLGGIGKTQIAVKYAYRSRKQGYYAHTIWVNAASEEAIMAGFVTIAELLPAFSAKNEKDQRKLLTAIKRWLEECQQRWLLIFDNADDPVLIQEYLPQTGNGSILLTTRANAVAPIGASLEVEKMGIVEGTQLLLRRGQRLENFSDQEQKKAETIACILDGFPLALDQAGAYIEETGCGFDDYLQLYQDHRKELLARRGKQATNYPDSVATTWSLSFQKIEQANPAAAELLHLCAFLAPDHIPEELLKDGASYWPPFLQQAATDLFAFNQILEELLTFSLVKRLVEDRLLSIHRLVQAVQIDKMEKKEQRQWAERVIRAVNVAFPRDPKGDVATWPQCVRYLVQAQRCDALIQQHLFVLSEAADLLERTGTYLCEHASYSIAEPLFLRALHIREQ